MKRWFFLFFLLLFPFYVYADDISYSDAQEAIQEVMRAYYYKSPYVQYSFGRGMHRNISPEEFTAQDIQYSVCSAFTHTIYIECFGMGAATNGLMGNGSVVNFPKLTTDITTHGKLYYENSNLPKNGNYLLYYENTVNDAYYAYSNSSDKISLDDFIAILKPGDIIGYTGHTLIVYDVVTNPKTHKLDALMLNVTSAPSILTDISYSLNKIYYNNFPSTYGENGILDIDFEGAIKYIWLSSVKKVVSDGNIQCSTDECTAIRPFYNDNGVARFNYEIDFNEYKKSQLRTLYSDLVIEKTVSSRDNNKVYLGDELDYVIKITNNSDKRYNSFNVVEEVSDYVTYKSSTGAYQDGTIKWDNLSLNAGASILLTYKVKVDKNAINIGKNVVSTGKFYNDNPNVYISTGKVVNPIIARTFDLSSSSLSSCYSSNATKTGLSFINSIYDCIGGTGVDFSNFNFANLFIKQNAPGLSTNDAIKFKDNLDANYSKIKDMILNNYWSGIVVYKSNDTGLAFWNPEGTSSGARAKTIYPSDFQDGDILIYKDDNNLLTGENGIYAYVYMDGKFIGNNSPNDGVSRNEFTFDWYIDTFGESAINKKLYSSYSTYKNDLSADELKYIVYQTLFGKEYYIILRPTKLENVYLELNNYNVQDDILYGISRNTDINMLKDNISTNGNVTIIDNDGNTADGNVKTGYIAKVIYGIETDSPLLYKLFIKGDVNGDGDVTITDLVKVKKHLTGVDLLADVYMVAGDVTDTGDISTTDLIRIARDIAKIENLD